MNVKKIVTEVTELKPFPLPLNPLCALWLIISIVLVSVLITFFIEPIPQDQSYHGFADKRIILAIPNFWNVISNLPLIAVGGIGIFYCIYGGLQGGLQELRVSYILFFCGVFLAGFGSSYYHYDPSNQTLVWDRLPMTLMFMAFFSAIISEFISVRWGRLLLWPLIIIGFSSIGYWYITELSGKGDLRAYALIQFLPIILTPLIMLLFRGSFNSNKMLWLVVFTYILAKLAEVLDRQIYELPGMLSGHTLKHFIAALAAYFYYLGLKTRRRDI